MGFSESFSSRSYIQQDSDKTHLAPIWSVNFLNFKNTYMNKFYMIPVIHLAHI